MYTHARTHTTSSTSARTSTGAILLVPYAYVSLPHPPPYVRHTYAPSANHDLKHDPFPSNRIQSFFFLCHTDGQTGVHTYIHHTNTRTPTNTPLLALLLGSSPNDQRIRRDSRLTSSCVCPFFDPSHPRSGPFFLKQPSSPSLCYPMSSNPHDYSDPNRQGQYPPPQWNTSQPEENPSAHYPPASQYPVC